MARTDNLENFLTDVADAIRDKKNITDTINATDFDTEIKSIEIGTDTLDATAVAEDIIEGKTAYAGGGKITGTLVVEDLETDLDEQQELLATQQTQIKTLISTLNVKSSGEKIKLNIFTQEEEPILKDGIWLQEDLDYENIVADENVFASAEWDTTKMSSLQPIAYDFYKGSAVSVGTTIYLFGNTSYYAYAYKYDTLTDTYTQLTAFSRRK